MMFEVDSAERLDALKALGDGVAMHTQALGYLFDVAPILQVYLQSIEHSGAFMRLVVACNGGNLFQVELVEGFTIPVGHPELPVILRRWPALW